MKTNIINYLVTCFFLGLLCSCSVEQEHKYHVVFLQCCHDPWRDVMNSEMKRELVFHPEIKLEILESYSDTQTQIEQIQEAIRQKVDLLIVSPNESIPLNNVIEKAYKAGVPVILIDRKTPTENYTAFIGADNYEIGKMAGRFISNQFKDKGNIIELKLFMTTSPAIERDRGFHEAIAINPKLKIVGAIETKNGLDDIKKNLPQLLSKHPEANIVFAHTDLIASVAYKVAQEQGRNKQLFFIGIDGIPETGGIQNVKNGVLDATLLYPTGGVEAIQTAVKILEKQHFEKDNRLLTNVITPDNVDIMLSQIRKIKEQQIDIERQALKIGALNRTFSSQRNRLYFTTVLLTIVVLLGTFLVFILREKQEYNKILEEQNHAISMQKNEIEKVSNLARKATEDKMRFYAYISHEFKTPLSLILTPTDNLLSEKSIDVTETRHTLRLIQKNANRLLRLVDQLLELRKLDAGKMVLEKEVHDLVSFIREIVLDFRLKANEQNIDLQFVCALKSLPFHFDADKLDKVFFNIISNAFKYTPRGGAIHIHLVKDIAQIVVSITDNGVGMNEEEQRRAFDLFYRGNKNISFGTGLGLALSQEFVNLHGGEITIMSEKNKGTTFHVFLPYQPIDPGQEVSDVTKAREAEYRFIDDESGFLEKKAMTNFENTIVLIEDNLALNHFLQDKLVKSYNIVATANAEDGWNEILTHIPDLVISDVMLPQMDGFMLTKQLKHDFRTSHIPVILLTAKGQIENQIEGIKAGADAYIAKPFNQQLLEEKIKGLLENRDRMRKRFSHEVVNPTHVHKGERKFLVEFDALIEKNIKNSSLSVEKLSQELGMSRVQLFRKISAITNKNVTEYIAEYKLQKAKTLLKDPEKNIAEIAYEIGFNTPSYFTTFFKQKTNLTPSEWRNQIGNIF